MGSAGALVLAAAPPLSSRRSPHSPSASRPASPSPRLRHDAGLRPDAPAAAVGLVNGAAVLVILVCTPLAGLTFSLPGDGRLAFLAIGLAWATALLAVGRASQAVDNRLLGKRIAKERTWPWLRRHRPARPAVSASRRAHGPRRDPRVRIRLDVRFPRSLAGLVSDPDARRGRDLDHEVRPSGDESGTRDPTIVASLYATLHDISNGRMVMGIGRGDSAVRYIGPQPVKVAESSATSP